MAYGETAAGDESAVEKKEPEQEKSEKKDRGVITKVVTGVVVGVLVMVLGGLLVNRFVNPPPSTEPIVGTPVVRFPEAAASPTPTPTVASPEVDPTAAPSASAAGNSGETDGFRFADWGEDGWLFPGRTIDELPTPPQDIDLTYVWAAEQGGVQLAREQIFFSVKGAASGVVTLLDLDLIVEESEDPPPGDVVVFQTGANLLPRHFAATVSQGAVEPEVVSRPSDFGDEGEPYSFPYAVSDSDVESLWVLVEANDCYCSFRLRLEWDDTQGKRGSTLIPPESDPPFRVTSVPSDRPVYSYTPESGEWMVNPSSAASQ